MGCFRSNSYGGTSFVDATTACNEVNDDDVNDYFRSTLSESLSIYNIREKDCRVQKCVSFARAVQSSCSDNDNTDTITDSGSTLTMRKRRRDFEDDYQCCSDVFTLMEDASRVLVLGYATSWMYINGNVTRIIHGLHVPGLGSVFFQLPSMCEWTAYILSYLKVGICIYRSQKFLSHRPFPKMVTLGSIWI